MILVGTDDGIYRWYEGGPWLTFHSLQGRSIVGLASPGAGVIIAVDNTGHVWETTNNGMDWTDIPRPAGGAGRTTALAVGDTPASLFVASTPLSLYRRPVGAPVVYPSAPPIAAFVGRAWGLALGSGRSTATLEAPTQGGGDANSWQALGVPSVREAKAQPEIRSLTIGADAWFAAVTGAGLWRSDDVGMSWVPCPGLPTEVYTVRRVPGSAAGVAVATADGYWVSDDHGRTWTDKSAGLENARHVRALEVRPDDPKYLLVGAAPPAQAVSGVAPNQGLGFALYESKDAGKSWSQVKRGFPARLEYDTIDDIRWDPAAPGYAIIALDSGECWRTRSNGDWWEPIARQTRHARVLCAVN